MKSRVRYIRHDHPEYYNIKWDLYYDAYTILNRIQLTNIDHMRISGN